MAEVSGLNVYYKTEKLLEENLWFLTLGYTVYIIQI